MRTYTVLPTGAAAKLLTTNAGTTHVVATLPNAQLASDLANELTLLSRELLTDATNPGLPDALRTLGIRKAEVQHEPGQLLLSELADRLGPGTQPGAAWRSTGIPTVWYLGTVLNRIDGLPQGPARSLRRELAELLSGADGLIVAATVTADESDADVTFTITSWLATATDDELGAIIADDYGAGYGTDAIAYAFEDLAAPMMGSGFSVRVDPEATRSWLQTYRPHLLDE